MTICVGSRGQPARSSHAHADSQWLGHVKARPAGELARYVDYYWVSRWDRRGRPSRLAAALLDPCVHLHVCDGRAEIMGVVRGLHRRQMEGVGCVIGVRFKPGGFYPFAGQSVAQFTDRSVPAEDAFSALIEPTADWARELSGAVDACSGGADAHAALIAKRFDDFLTPLLPEHDAVAEEMGSIVALLATSTDVRRMSGLAQASGRSERTLHRLFNRYVGVSPAWVFRRYRLHAATERLTADPAADIQGLAYELGYADQAHFIRDFRRTIGVSPGAYAEMVR